MFSRIFAAIVATTFLCGLSLAQHTHHVKDSVQYEECRRGDFLCDHETFHPIYVFLEFLTGQSCCHKQEGRPTKDIEDASPEDKSHGIDFKVYIDGMWCNASKSTLMKVPDAKKKDFFEYKKVNPALFYAFLEFDHAFAPKAPEANGIRTCPSVFCIYKKEPPT
ncbi:hypothetical protein KW798_01225 [Candidatus Parcubacteria bacterium]|nr:hypothetical protein [Candidatus Parcubacteria bacterium]